MSDESYTVYILRCADNSLYTGIAKDLERRIDEHRTGKGSKYVRAKLPCVLVYQESATNRSVASKREAEIKSYTREQKEALLLK